MCAVDVDPYCCDTAWDSLCRGTAASLSNADDGAFRCCNCKYVSSPGCLADSDCQSFICSNDPYCCNTRWDLICVGSATDECSRYSRRILEADEANFENKSGAAWIKWTVCVILFAFTLGIHHYYFKK